MEDLNDLHSSPLQIVSDNPPLQAQEVVTILPLNEPENFLSFQTQETIPILPFQNDLDPTALRSSPFTFYAIWWFILLFKKENDTLTLHFFFLLPFDTPTCHVLSRVTMKEKMQLFLAFHPWDTCVSSKTTHSEPLRWTELTT